MAMSSFDTQDLVIANRILAKEDVVDAYGHVSIRHPDNLSQGEMDARNRGYSPYSTETWRAWEYWANKTGCGHMLSRPD
jgi:hypothetical protein